MGKPKWGNQVIWQHGTDQHYVVLGLAEDTKGNWEHWAFVGSAKGNFMKILRNGSEVAKRVVKPAFQSSPQTWHIGGRVGSSFDGVIDEVAVFNLPLSESDISSIMTKGLSRALSITAVSPSGKVSTAWGRVKTQ
ncbi:TPA: LamG domain-containing protein [Candidatus Poribacteria bacterium]|nr:LamG domain-containing protein [Candidatus Poribacteria bacterium]